MDRRIRDREGMAGRYSPPRSPRRSPNGSSSSAGNELTTRRQAPPVSQDPRAYRALLRGNFLNQFRTESGLRRSIRCFEQALEWDPNCAAAYRVACRGAPEPRLAWLRAAGRGRRARRAPPSRARWKSTDSTWRALGARLAATSRRLGRCGRGRGARRRSRAPSPATIGSRGSAPTSRLRWVTSSAAVAVLESALDIDPLSPNLLSTRIYALWYAGRTEEALTAGRALAEAEPEFATAHANRGIAAATLGHFDEAIRAAETADALARGDQFTRSTCAWIFAVAGRPELARAILATLERRSRSRYVSPSCMALGYVGLGDRESALAWLERAPEQRCMWFPFVLVDSRMAALRGDPRFDALQRQSVRPTRIVRAELGPHPPRPADQNLLKTRSPPDGKIRPRSWTARGRKHGSNHRRRWLDPGARIASADRAADRGSAGWHGPGAGRRGSVVLDRADRTTRRTDRALPGFAARPGADGVHLSARGRRGAALDRSPTRR